jgi:superfamily I DNA/RNA helicase
MAVLFRSLRTSAGSFLAAFAREGIPYAVAGPSGLFQRPEIREMASLFAWIAGEPLQLDRRSSPLLPEGPPQLEPVRRAAREGRFPGLTALFQEILRARGFPSDPVAAANLGRWNEVLAERLGNSSGGAFRNRWRVIGISILSTGRIPSVNNNSSTP